jgi:hypothetical protein
MRSILFFALLGFATAGVPQDGHARRAATTNSFCAVVTKLVTIAKQQAAATSFCSSYHFYNYKDGHHNFDFYHRNQGSSDEHLL